MTSERYSRGIFRLVDWVRAAAFFLIVSGGVIALTAAETRIEDIFNRDITTRGITLLDWEGYLANPLIKFYVFPPADATFPASAKLSANGARLYFDSPSSVSAKGPGKAIS